MRGMQRDEDGTRTGHLAWRWFGGLSAIVATVERQARNHGYVTWLRSHAFVPFALKTTS